MAETKSPYSPGFFAGNARSSMPSAVPILQLLRDLYSPTSIVDIGCGSGAWLTAAEEVGFTVLRGYDGPWADPTRYTSPNIDFTPVDLEHADLEHDRRYDLAMSVEVAEHLSAARADFIVDALCNASDVVLFSAAVPYQGGVHHIHEKPQTFWKAKFNDRGYQAFDIIRPAVWDNDEIKWWFRQNALLYVKEGAAVLDADKLRAMEDHIWDLVHPAALAHRTKTSRQQIQALRTERDDLARKVERLERQLNGGPQRRRPLPARVKQALPEPLRAPAARAWRALPEKTRATLTGWSAKR